MAQTLSAPVQAQVDSLLQAIRQTPQYTQFMAARDRAMQKPGLWDRIQKSRQLQMQLHGLSLAGRRDEELEEALAQLLSTMQYDTAAREYDQAEYALHALLSEVFAAIGQAAEVDMAFADGEG